jgi:uncharacterized protein (DUF1800 family)
MRLNTLTAAVLFLFLLCMARSVTAQDDQDPNSPSPVLLSSPDKERVLAVDAAAFRGVLPSYSTEVFKLGQRRSVAIFLSPLPMLVDEGANAFRVYLKQSDGRTFELFTEDISRTKNGVIALKVRLFDTDGYRGQPVSGGDSWIYVTWRGIASNYLKIGIGGVGGKLPAPPDIPKLKQETGTGAADYVGYRWSGDRVRFLEQAAFGPSTMVDDRIRRIGIRAWLAEQFDAPYPYIPLPNPPQMPTVPPTDCSAGTNPTCFRDRYTMVPLQQWFFKEAFYGNAQLRHRVAWALSQILVTSGVATQQSSHAIAYHKILESDAFGNYRQLLADVTLSPTMGNYLDMVRSTKDNPNENYPREILQLFSIGLFMLNQDGTLKLDGQGNPIQTYDQNVINNFSRVFTGWTFCNNAGCPNAVPGSVNYKDPMVLVPANHDLSAKTLLSYPGAVNQPIAPCANCTDAASTTAYANDSLARALDNIFNHPNLGPFIGKLMIQHLVMSDPSPAYVARVAAAFNYNNFGVRGDMRSVIRAVLLDPEARGDLKTAPRYGKLREPVQLITNLGRIFPAKAFNQVDPSDGAVSSNSASMGENPFYSPTVFNYFMSDHIVPGTTILAPEFDLLNTGTAVKRTNFLFLLTFEGITPNATDALRGTSLDYSEFIPYAEADASGNQLLDVLNSKMMHGVLTPAHRSLILTAVQAVSAADPAMRVRTAVYLLACSSQYQVQR